ncbi:MAG: hypothetical protein IJ458_03115 [Clostridia bacterium]|nr:hypothetical protein [Clostridia bacterium]
MIWQIVLLIVIFLLIIPIPIKFNLKLNVLNLSGAVQIILFRFINFKLRVRFRGAYIYITRNNKTRREKLTSKNFNVAFVIQFVRQIYFRLILQTLNFASDVGYYNDAMVTATSSSLIDIASKCLHARILHNKKSAHIFISNETKYNQDCLNLKIGGQINICIFDIIYSIINTIWSLKGVEYETRSYENK